MRQRIKLPTAKTISIGVLVAASTGLIMEAYTPYPQMASNPHHNQIEYRQMVSALYLRDVPKTYDRPMKVWTEGMSTKYHVGPKAWGYSEERKKSIQQSLNKINAIRKQIRVQAEVEVYRRDHETRIVAKTPEQKRLLHAEILLTRISMIKQA